METEWSVAVAADDPVMEVPWSDAVSGATWVNLRVEAVLQSGRIAALPETASAPVLAWALAQLNVPEGRWRTAKCDRWQMSQAEREELADSLGSPIPARGMASYIDVLLTSPKAMADFLLHEQLARIAARRCASIDMECARIELIVRAAVLNHAWGYGLTLYCYGGGRDEPCAEQTWTETLEKAISLLIACADELLAVAV